MYRKEGETHSVIVGYSLLPLGDEAGMFLLLLLRSVSLLETKPLHSITPIQNLLLHHMHSTRNSD
jgi:hypothetical protein